MVYLRSGFQTNPADRKLQIFFKMLQSETKLLCIPLSITGHEIKRILMAEHGLQEWRCDRLRLIFAGHSIEDSETLLEHDVRSLSTIHVTGRFGSDRLCGICRVPPRPSEECSCSNVNQSLTGVRSDSQLVQ